MDDDKGLELSLGLACGGSSSSSKDRSGNSADGKADTDERTNKILNDFKNFLGAGVSQSLQRNDAVKPQENFFSNLQHGGNSSGDEPGVGESKCKCVFDEMNKQKKQETGFHDSDVQEEGKTSHISITTDEGSTTDNEDVAESEAEGSTSRLVSHHEDESRTPGGSGSYSSQAPKELCGKANTSAPFSVQSMNVGNIPYSITIKEPTSVSAASTSSYALTGMMQGITSTNGVHPRPHTTAAGSAPMSFGYSPVQLPVLDNKDDPWRMGPHPQSLPTPYGGISISTSVPMQVNHSSPSDSPRRDMRPLELSKGQTLLAEEGSSSQVEDDAKGRGNSFPLEFPAIRPGIASEVKFGGSGSFPNLPWVSTTCPGPNGRTISGVTYKYNATQVKIVCACHGIHMSPEEFIQHATEEERNPVSTPNIASLQSTNPATSAKT